MMKIMFLAIFAAVLTLHVFVEGELVKPGHEYDCYWKVSNASDRVCRNHGQDGFFFFNVLHVCSTIAYRGQHRTATDLPGIPCGYGHLE
uniref:Putative secreted protein n=1 Tax=Ixodes ricinus TaxID=34613 RepID=V5H9W0_IXORI